MLSLYGQELTEIDEANVSAVLKPTYAEIKDYLRVPLVNLVFRVLANYPEYLQLAWRQLRPNVQTMYFESRADALRARAVEGMAGLDQAPVPSDPAITETLKVFHYVNPKLLLAIAALRAATNGQYPRLEELPAAEKRPIGRGVPEGMPNPALVDPATASGRARQVFDAIMSAGSPVINTDYRALATWPEYLESAWQTVSPLRDRPEFRLLERELRRITEETILVMPFRVEINPHTMRLCGMGEPEIDGVRAILDRFYRLLPGLILNISFLASGALGGQATASPYPPAAR